MIMKYFSIYDTKTGAYMRPFLAFTSGQAERDFTSEVNREGSDIGRNPEDYTLFEIGAFDDISGKIEPLSTPHSVVTALQVKRLAA